MANQLKVSLENIIPLTEARDHFSQIVAEVQQDKLYVLTKGGKPAVAIVDVKYLEQITGGQVRPEQIHEEIKKAPEKVGLPPMVEHKAPPPPKPSVLPPKPTPPPPVVPAQPKPITPTPSPTVPPSPTPSPTPTSPPAKQAGVFQAEPEITPPKSEPAKPPTPPATSPKPPASNPFAGPAQTNPSPAKPEPKKEPPQPKPPVDVESIQSTMPNNNKPKTPDPNAPSINVSPTIPDEEELKKRDGKNPKDDLTAPDDKAGPAQYTGDDEEPEDMGID